MVPMNSLSVVFTEMPSSGMLRKGRLELLLNLRPQHNYGAEMVPFPPLKSFHLPQMKFHLLCISVVYNLRELGTTTLNPIIGVFPFEGK